MGDIFLEDDCRKGDAASENDTALFKDTEWDMMKLVSDKFKGKTTKQIVDISHKEPAWQENVGEYQRISFEYGFELRNID